jgi:two-component system phosphate regulon sensor histidine kinase PhoR
VLSLFAAQAAVAIENARLYDDLVRADQLKALILDIASHDLRNPLTHVKSYVEMLAEGYIPKDDLPHAIEMMEQAVERMEALLDDLVELQRVEVDQEAEENVDLTALAREALEACRPEADAKGHRMRMVFDKEPLMVLGRRIQLRQAINNLVTNAIKYTPAGGSVTLAVEEETEEVRLRVADTGPGIAPEHLPHLFEPFYRAPQPEEGQVRGTGLGLSLVKRVAQRHGGHVWVESQVGVGSTFGFAIPKPKHPPQDD